ncbi:Uncharacterized conserved protein, DUF849 family [Haladaptatus litoreus]|uniref:Uncharacterized conserved protein, DUF849 family n=1 Tax=Haladaptatus litoreus TaxID=553468 RepID=A0A1N6ZJZ7_9EURY|nr:3-keto-5-aminohexanoate cleavage protein [Haladaptatus litoreus]SIR27220.1 Uncharacterized conserved protein, DUF849 family [Haladaptatus litoreus]
MSGNKTAQTAENAGRRDALHQNLYDDLAFNELESSSTFTPEMAKEFFLVHREDSIDTMDSPVIIECAYPGWQAGGDHYPAVPDTKEEQSLELIESVEAGAAAVHVHPRNEQRRPQWEDPELLAEILDPVEVECGEVVTTSQTWTTGPHADYVTATEKLLRLGEDNKFCQGSVVLPMGLFGAGTYHSPSSIKEGVRFFGENGIKPVFQLYDTHVLYDLKHRLFDKEDLNEESHLLNLYLGAHHSQTTNNDPWSYLNVISSIYNTRETVDDSIVGVNPGGRNWLPTLILGLLAGANVVRVGIEDAYWKYPHRDEVIQKNSEVIELAVEFAEMLSRRVITDPDEAREFLGMEYTSPR